MARLVGYIVKTREGYALPNGRKTTLYKPILGGKYLRRWARNFGNSETKPVLTPIYDYRRRV